MLAGCGGAATGNEDAVNDDGSVDLDEGHPDRRRPEGRLQGAAPGRRRARRRALRDRVEGVHLRPAAARGAQRRRDPRRRRRQHPAALRGRRPRASSRWSRPRRTAARATRSSCRRTPTSQSVADLKGKKVAVAEGSSANYNLLAQLEEAGLDYERRRGREPPARRRAGGVLRRPRRRLGDLGAVHLAGRARGRRPGDHRPARASSTATSSRSPPTTALEDPATTAALEDYVGRIARAQVWSQTHRRSGPRSGPRRPASAEDITLARAEEARDRAGPDRRRR